MSPEDRLAPAPEGSGPCRRRRSAVTRIRDWWDLRRGRYDRILARMNPLGGPGEPPEDAPVREPRRPRPPSLSGGVALDLPDR
jgi:hypothetical protein